MQELLAKLNQLIELATSKIAAAEKALQEANVRKVQLDDYQKELHTLKFNLDEREKKIARVEDIRILEEKAKKAIDTTAIQMKELDIKLKAFDAYQTKVANDFASQKKNFDTIAANLKAKEAELIKKEVDLKAEKDNLKKKVLEELQIKLK